jgi:hypothetical protein
MKRATDTEFVIAASVNVLTLRALAAGMGAPGWVGAMAAGVSMAVSADKTAPARVRQIADLLSAPGALAIQIIRENPQLNAAGPPADGKNNGTAK